MSEHQNETAFLRQIIRYDDSDECRKLEKSIAQVQQDVRSVQRVALVTALFPLLAIVGVAYGEILQESFSYPGSDLVFRVLCDLGLASLVCLVGLAGLVMVYRRKLNRLRKECFRLVLRLLESHLGKREIPTVPMSPRVFGDREALQGSMEFSV